MSQVIYKKKRRNNNILTERITFVSEKNYVYFKNTAVLSFLPLVFISQTIPFEEREIHTKLERQEGG